MKYLNKKGQVFVSFLFVMTLTVFIFAFIQMENKYTFWTKDGIEKKLGDLQFELIDKYAQGEGYLFYLDRSAKYSLDLAFYYLAENGGYFSDEGFLEYEIENSIQSECGDYNGYQIWKLEYKECYPDYKENFMLYFYSYFSQYLRQADIFAQQDYESNFVLEYLEKEDILGIIGNSIEPYKEILLREGQEPIMEEEPRKEVSVSGLAWPSSSRTISSCYGWRTLQGKRDYHDGIDIAAVTGSAVYAAEDGIVYLTQSNCKQGVKSCGSGFGNYVVIKHGDNLFSAYHHLSSVSVVKGQQVEKGQIIAKSGNTGYSLAPHLDFKLYDSASAVHKKDAATINPICIYENMQLAGKQCTC